MRFDFTPPPGCVLVAVDSAPSRPDEMCLLRSNAVQKRKNEFALGRAAARRALEELGICDSGPLLRGQYREPLWPDGVVGSITHCGPWAMAAAAKAENVRALGIDVEDVSRIEDLEIATLVANDTERRWIEGSRLRLAMLFSGKESIYKALFPLARRFFDFLAVELTWVPERSSFAGQLRLSLCAELSEGHPIEAGCQLRNNFVFTHTLLPSR
jgi:4'-phosphopantetheinyl transferase EntD